ncbi:hypothetical protein NX059_010791 [Plenodomus lindquistii]|nr:hypothetical protein NX059_010791 [Plenodomus lindquistii]
MTRTAYPYTPLSTTTTTIRTLEVSDPDSAGGLVCRLSDTPFENNHDFTALSYCWGARQGTIPTRFTLANGEHALLDITPSLDSFLRQFLADHPKECIRPKLWVDAVCINQNDPEEKALQIAIMHKIYQQAQRVIVWLGEGTKQTDKGMNFIPELISAGNRAARLKESGDGIVGAQHFTPKQLDLPRNRNDDDEYASFISLLKRDWFERVWIIQEVAMADDVVLQCGAKSCTWDGFIKAFYVLTGLDTIFPDPARYTKVVSRVLGIMDARESRMKDHKRDLLGIMLLSRPALATCLGDKVFALLGLATDVTAQDFQVDVKSSVQRVYTGIAYTIIKSERKLDVLGVPNIKKATSVEGLPSWVPDWSTWDSTLSLNRRDRPLSYDGDDEILVRNAAGSSAAVPILKDAHTLGLEGYETDHITEMGAVYGSEDALLNYNIWLIDVFKFYKQQNQTLLQWENMSKARSGGVYHHTGQPMIEAYWQTITAGWQVAEDSLSTPVYLKWDAYYRPGATIRRLIGRMATTSACAWVTFSLNCAKQIFKSAPEFGLDRSLGMASNRRLIRSKLGYLGLAPAATQIGDSIALFKGGGSPFIIRSAGKQQWELIGDSYVHGMMDGDCFDAARCHDMWLV